MAERDRDKTTDNQHGVGFGAEHLVDKDTRAMCPVCAGKGYYKTVYEAINCDACNGTGMPPAATDTDLEQEFEVIVTNNILGNTTHVRTLTDIKSFNVVAYKCALKAAQDGQSHTDGMWTVRPCKQQAATGDVEKPFHSDDKKY